MGNAPLWLALAFAFGMTIAFGLTITSSVRLRRRDLALLKMLGFTRRQMRSCIAWQASASVATGVIVGIPLGILLGRELWTLFAQEIYAVPFAAVPTISLAILGVGALALANLVALIPQEERPELTTEQVAEWNAHEHTHHRVDARLIDDRCGCGSSGEAQCLEDRQIASPTTHRGDQRDGQCADRAAAMRCREQHRGQSRQSGSRRSEPGAGRRGR